MAYEYRLTLAGDIPLEQVARLAAPEATEAPARPDYPRLFTADLYEERGYILYVTSGSQGYYDAEDDDGSRWEWEPQTYVDVDFRMRKNDPSHDGEANMVAAVARVLSGRTEDAALTLNGNYLLLTRVEGRVHKHRASWWNVYGVGDLVSG